MSASGSPSFFFAEWLHFVSSYSEGYYRVYDPAFPIQTVAYIDSPDDLPDLQLFFVDGPLAGAQFPLDITGLTDTAIL